MAAAMVAVAGDVTVTGAGSMGASAGSGAGAVGGSTDQPLSVATGSVDDKGDDGGAAFGLGWGGLGSVKGT